MRIALFGPPGAGKGTQATIIEHRYGFRSISTGALIRAAMREGTPLGLEAQGFVEEGRLVPDDLVRRLAEEAVAECAFDGFILDGYPRTIGQAEALDAFLARHGAPLTALISMDVPADRIVARLSGRRIHPVTGATYHLVHHPPPPEVDPGALVQRADDRPDAVRRRLEEYATLTEPVLHYYADAGRLVRMSGTGTVLEVSRRLARILADLAVPA